MFSLKSKSQVLKMRDFINSSIVAHSAPLDSCKKAFLVLVLVLHEICTLTWDSLLTTATIGAMLILLIYLNLLQLQFRD